MADQKISQLTTIATVDNATDLFPIVDTSVGETKKITPTALKSALALNNVDNTTDLNKPISTLTQTALDGKQATLVSATNIKTINSTSLLGSGDIVVGATPSGVAGAIQFSNGTAFASDAANLFFDDTNNRLGVGTNVPTARLQVKGTGSTSATTSLLVQNSAGTAALTVKDDLNIKLWPASQLQWEDTYNSIVKGRGGIDGLSIIGYAGVAIGTAVTTNTFVVRENSASLGISVADASAIFDITSTTKGFLPPRLTTVQKNAIVTPAAGLIVYDTTLNKLCVRTVATWETISSV